MSTETNKTIARRNFERLDQRDVEGVIADFSPDIRIHGFAPHPTGIAEYRPGIEAFLAAFPDSRVRVDDVISEGDKVVVRHTFCGTHRGEFQGIPPTGQQVSVSAIEILRFEGDAIAEA